MIPRRHTRTFITTAVNRLHTQQGRYAFCTMCIDVGQGIAAVMPARAIKQ